MLNSIITWMQGRAAELDRDAAFPALELPRLHRLGALGIDMPVRLAEGASGANAADALAAMLIEAGQGNLSVGRIVEAHINTLHLAGRYGSARQWEATATAARDGCLFALWVTDPAEGGLQMRQHAGSIRLEGRKQFCSGAGHAGGVLVTARDEDGATRMLVFRLGIGERTTALPAPLQGMRAAVTGAVDFTGCVVPADSVLGEPGDYLREPDFSAGAWRGSAVALGGMVALLDHTVSQLRAAGRLDAPHMQARLGEALIARETARLWVRSAARIAEDNAADTAFRVATVGLARLAVETACLDAMRLAQRSLGLSAFRHGNPVELICRDLATYLRQPAPDQVLTEAGAWFAAHPAATVLT